MNAEKLNIVWLAKHHRKHCEGEDCTAEKAGISFTRKELKVFI